MLFAFQVMKDPSTVIVARSRPGQRAWQVAGRLAQRLNSGLQELRYVPLVARTLRLAPGRAQIVTKGVNP